MQNSETVQLNLVELLYLNSWKIKAKIVKSLTPDEQQKEFRNKSGEGEKCIYLLGDESGRNITLVSYDEYAKQLESLQINEV